MAADERLKLIRRKIERADEHIRNLQGALRWFFHTQPYKIATKNNPKTGQIVYYLGNVAPIPSVIPAIAGDVLNNLRSSLDHLVQQLYLVGTGGANGYCDKVAFMMAPRAKDFKAGLPRKVQGLRQEAIDAICALEPYKGGNGEDLWTLDRLNNIDKHRMIVMVGSSFRSVNIGAMIGRMMKITAAAGSHIPKIDLFVRPADNLFPLEAGDELAMLGPNMEPYEHDNFRFEVVIHEPGVVEGKPIFETLMGFRDRVSNVVDGFGPLLA